MVQRANLSISCCLCVLLQWASFIMDEGEIQPGRNPTWVADQREWTVNRLVPGHLEPHLSPARFWTHCVGGSPHPHYSALVMFCFMLPVGAQLISAHTLRNFVGVCKNLMVIHKLFIDRLAIAVGLLPVGYLCTAPKPPLCDSWARSSVVIRHQPGAEKERSEQVLTCRFGLLMISEPGTLRQTSWIDRERNQL